MTQIFTSLSQDEFENLLKECIRTEIISLTQSKSEPEAEELLTVNQVCKLLSISKVTCSKWRKEGKLPFQRIGTRVRFRKSEVLQSLQSPKKYTEQ